MNIVVLCGSISSSIVTRDLASGSRSVSFDVATTTSSGAVSVPASWIDPPSTPVWEIGHEVVIVGVVRRRFFRAGGSTHSRTEVLVTEAVDAKRRQQVRKLLGRASSALVTVT